MINAKSLIEELEQRTGNQLKARVVGVFAELIDRENKRMEAHNKMWSWCPEQQNYQPTEGLQGRRRLLEIQIELW